MRVKEKVTKSVINLKKVRIVFLFIWNMDVSSFKQPWLTLEQKSTGVDNAAFEADQPMTLDELGTGKKNKKKKSKKASQNDDVST